MRYEYLDPQHWQYGDYKQRIEAKQWRAMLLNDEDNIMFNGRCYNLVAKNLGYGVVEVSKEAR